MVYYHVCVPNLDVIDEDEDRLQRTTVAQVFAFILQALRAPSPRSSWHNAAADLGTWAVEYDDILSKIPPPVRKDKERASPYKRSCGRGFQRSPIRTRSTCQPPNTGHFPQDDSDNEDGDGAPPSPTRHRSTRPSKKDTNAGKGSGGQKRKRSGGGQQDNTARESMEDQPYCTQQCLLGLANGQPTDESCPNARSHGPQHIDPAEFLRLVRAQADILPLHLSGSVGALFKVRSSAYGYTLVAKGVEAENLERLQHEEQVYGQIRALQGRDTPVCLGLLDLARPYYFDGCIFTHFLLLSFSGRSLVWCTTQIDKASATDAIRAAFTRLHQLRVLHCDAEPRNILYDAASGSLMVTDFERAQFRRALSSINPNSQHPKRERQALQKQPRDDFTRELRSVVESVSRCFDAHRAAR
ncbi:hypothetical protein OQA88_12647 [Cercophora sp. LCS_1]